MGPDNLSGSPRGVKGGLRIVRAAGGSGAPSVPSSIGTAASTRRSAPRRGDALLPVYTIPAPYRSSTGRISARSSSGRAFPAASSLPAARSKRATQSSSLSQRER